MKGLTATDRCQWANLHMVEQPQEEDVADEDVREAGVKELPQEQSSSQGPRGVHRITTNQLWSSCSPPGRVL